MLAKIAGILCAVLLGNGLTFVGTAEQQMSVIITETETCPLPLDDWRMVLVNREHPLPEGFQAKLVPLANGMQIDARCVEDLTAMLEDCRETGCVPVVCSAYRTVEYQTRLYEQKIRRLERGGMETEAAVMEAGTVVAVPGTSEHHLGLAVDIVDQCYQCLNTAQEETPVQKWLLEHCWEYGFILRYPDGKSEITGIIYEPWHYRYVGREVAMDIRDRGVCFEEYLELFL